MTLPENFPRELRLLAEHGYQSRSGNIARLELAAQATGKERFTGAVLWNRKPSRADVEELEASFTNVNIAGRAFLDEPDVFNRISDFPEGLTANALPLVQTTRSESTL